MCQVVSGSKLCKDTGYRNSNFSHAGFETLHGQNKSFYPEPLTTHLHTLTSLKVSAATPPPPTSLWQEFLNICVQRAHL